MTKRVYKWDNIKAVLIFFVVFGHALNRFTDYSGIYRGLYYFIYLFHMPLFIFVSGLFSKNIIRKKQWNKVISYFFLYLIIRILDEIARYLKKGEVDFHLLETAGPDWYAFVIGCFLIITIIIRDFPVKYILFFSILTGLISGCDNWLGINFSSMRICVFYFFFYLGYVCERKKLEEINSKYIAITAFILFVCIGIYFILHGDDYFDYLNLIRGKTCYEKLELDYLTGIYNRILHYISSLIIGFLVIVFVPDKKMIITETGGRTLSVFTFHYLLLNYINSIEYDIEGISQNPYLCIFILCIISILIIWLLIQKPFIYIEKIFVSEKN